MSSPTIVNYAVLPMNQYFKKVDALSFQVQNPLSNLAIDVFNSPTFYQANTNAVYQLTPTGKVQTWTETPPAYNNSVLQTIRNFRLTDYFSSPYFPYPFDPSFKILVTRYTIENELILLSLPGQSHTPPLCSDSPLPTADASGNIYIGIDVLAHSTYSNVNITAQASDKWTNVNGTTCRASVPADPATYPWRRIQGSIKFLAGTASDINLGSILWYNYTPSSTEAYTYQLNQNRLVLRISPDAADYASFFTKYEGLQISLQVDLTSIPSVVLDYVSPNVVAQLL